MAHGKTREETQFVRAKVARNASKGGSGQPASFAAAILIRPALSQVRAPEITFATRSTLRPLVIVSRTASQLNSSVNRLCLFPSPLTTLTSFACRSLLFTPLMATSSTFH
jgi:hypothetical protein